MEVKRVGTENEVEVDSSIKLLKQLIETIEQMREQQELILDAQVEILEKVNNLSREGVDYSIED